MPQYKEYQCYKTDVGLFPSVATYTAAGATEFERINLPADKARLLPFINDLVREARQQVLAQLAVGSHIAPPPPQETTQQTPTENTGKEHWELEWEKLPYEVRLRAYCAAALG